MRLLTCVSSQICHLLQKVVILNIMMNNSIDKETEKIINANEYIAVRKNYDHQFSSYYGVLAD